MRYIILLLTLTLPLLVIAEDGVVNPDEPVPVSTDTPAPAEPTPEPAPVTGEADDTIGGASRYRPTEKGRLIRAELLSPQDIDYFQVDMPSDGNLTVEVSQLEPSGDSPLIGWRTEFFSEQNLAESLYTLELPQATLSDTYDLGLAAGTYYLKVSSMHTDFAPTSGYRVTLTLNASDSYEKTPNNTPADATPIILNKQLFGGLSSPTDKDFFRLSMTAEGAVSITLRQQSIGTNPVAGWRLSLFNEFDLGNPLQVVDLPETAVATGFPPDLFLGIGNYYLTIEPLNVGVAPQTTYELRVASTIAGDPVTDCADVLTYGIHPATLRWVVFPTPCDVPMGWFKTVIKPAEVAEVITLQEPTLPALSFENSILTLPAVEVPDDRGRISVFEVQLRLLPIVDGQPITFEVVMESLAPVQ